MIHLEFTVLKDDEDKRIDNFLNINLEDISRSRIQKLIEENQILVNNKNINKNYKLRKDDIISVNIEEPKEIDILPENIPLDIVYEDDDVILINKPQDMVVHPANGHYTGTLVNGLMYHCKDNLSGINGIMRPGIVHRIDKDTSGILVVAKNDKAHKNLAIQLENHSMTRVYYAIVYNNLKNDKGTIDAPIGRHPIDRKKMAVTNKNSKRAVTHYEVLKRFKNHTLIKLKLETGRTHQIRVHMAYIGNPLLGDIVYGKQKQPFNLVGQVLHAKVLGFIHPTSNKYMEFETDLPYYFKNVLNKL
ncbi:RluA family pseudouridine synthase [[Clostridium] colinum]|uniref:RluA family pseudouridine synthase n=1 Tax=[Clostridium] colinum TaxID=36835 RepID=UPI002023BE87|nr:RluA family pseudouridine synthase [[Clostridium] colinum]